MKVSIILPFVAAATAFVLPKDEVMSQIAFEDNSKHGNSLFDQVQAGLPSKAQVKDIVVDAFASLYTSSKNVLDDAVERASDELKTTSDDLTAEYFDAKSWIASGCSRNKHSGPQHESDDEDKPRHPPHGKPHHKSNYTVYELISHSKYTTKLAELINSQPELVELLNSTKANFTVFAPTDEAFSKIPDHHKKPSDELIKKVLSYHVSGEFYPAGRILVSRTVPTLLEGKYLSADPEDTPQRLSTNVGLRGLTVNFYSRVVAVDIFGSNGVIHGVDSLLIPPPNIARIISLLPSEFSTLELALYKTGLFDVLNSTSNHLGATVFAPSNFAFAKLGPRINAFLFSEYGRKYLKAILEYHVVANQTLYSDAYYGGGDSEAMDGRHGIPRGQFHVSRFHNAQIYANRILDRSSNAPRG